MRPPVATAAASYARSTVAVNVAWWPTGHSHGAGVHRPRSDVKVRTGGACYGAPEVQSPLLT